MYYVYILHSLKDRRFYTGSTDDLRRRFKEHQQGKVKSTRNRRPLQLIYYEAYLLKEDALKRENFLKSNEGKKSLKKQLSIYLTGVRGSP